MPIKEDTVFQVGPLAFVGPAVERDRRILEDNDFEPVNVKTWMNAVQKHEAEMETSEVAFFAELRARVPEGR